MAEPTHRRHFPSSILNPPSPNSFPPPRPKPEDLPEGSRAGVLPAPSDSSSRYGTAGFEHLRAGLAAGGLPTFSSDAADRASRPRHDCSTLRLSRESILAREDGVFFGVTLI